MLKLKRTGVNERNLTIHLSLGYRLFRPANSQPQAGFQLIDHTFVQGRVCCCVAGQALVQAFPLHSEMAFEAGIGREGQEIRKADIQADADAQVKGNIGIVEGIGLAAGLDHTVLAIQHTRGDLKEEPFFEKRILFGPGRAMAIAFKIKGVNIGIQREPEGRQFELRNEVRGVQQSLRLFKLRIRNCWKELNAVIFQAKPVINTQLVRGLELEIWSKSIAVAPVEQGFPIGCGNFGETSGKSDLSKRQLCDATKRQTEQGIFHGDVISRLTIFSKRRGFRAFSTLHQAQYAGIHVITLVALIKVGFIVRHSNDSNTF